MRFGMSFKLSSTMSDFHFQEHDQRIIRKRKKKKKKKNSSVLLIYLIDLDLKVVPFDFSLTVIIFSVLFYLNKTNRIGRRRTISFYD